MDFKDKLTILFVSICAGVLAIITEYFFGNETIMFLVPALLYLISYIGIFVTLAQLYNDTGKVHIAFIFSFLQILIGVISYVLSLYCIKLGVFSLMSIIFTLSSIILGIYYLCVYLIMISEKE